MKVLITIPCLLTGGTEFQTLNLVKALKSVNHTVIVCCYYEYLDKMVDLYILNGAEVVLFSSQNEQRPIGVFKQISFLYKSLKKVVIKFKPNLAHVQYMSPGALPVFTLKLLRIKKIVATVHQPYTKNHGVLAKFLLHLSSFLCTRFIAVSKNAEISWFGSGQLFNENIPIKKQPRHFTIHNAVNVELIQEIKTKTEIKIEKENLGIKSSAIVFGAVSRLRHEKGIDILVEAFYRIQKENKNTHLLVVGAGADEKLLKDKVNQFKMNDKVTFFGEAKWETAMQQMALMDVVVVPSRFEGFGLTAAEAMAMGKPVVASNVFGLKEVVTDKQTGFLFESENWEDLYVKLKLMSEDKESYNYLSKNTSQEIHKFGMPIYFKKVIILHNQI